MAENTWGYDTAPQVAIGRLEWCDEDAVDMHDRPIRSHHPLPDFYHSMRESVLKDLRFGWQRPYVPIPDDPWKPEWSESILNSLTPEQRRFLIWYFANLILTLHFASQFMSTLSVVHKAVQRSNSDYVEPGGTPIEKGAIQDIRGLICDLCRYINRRRSPLKNVSKICSALDALCVGLLREANGDDGGENEQSGGEADDENANREADEEHDRYQKVQRRLFLQMKISEKRVSREGTSNLPSEDFVPAAIRETMRGIFFGSHLLQANAALIMSNPVVLIIYIDQKNLWCLLEKGGGERYLQHVGSIKDRIAERHAGKRESLGNERPILAVEEEGGPQESKRDSSEDEKDSCDRC